MPGAWLGFVGVEGKVVFNVTIPFTDNGRTFLAGRVESPESTRGGAIYDPQVVFFEPEGSRWVVARHLDVAPYSMEDPAIAKIGGELVLSGVEIFEDAEVQPGRNHRMTFFRGPHLESLRKFAVGPTGMKDVRLVEMKDGRVGIFSRPQNEKGWSGRIGFTVIRSLDELTPDVMEKAQIIPNQFVDDEWGGVKWATLLPDGRIGCIGHIACEGADGSRNYYATAFEFDPDKFKAAPFRIIASRRDFPPGVTKVESLRNEIFPDGIVRHGDGTATLYVGVSDRYGGTVVIKDPFGA